jgi:CheY-like chemotaxis protein
MTSHNGKSDTNMHLSFQPSFGQVKRQVPQSTLADWQVDALQRLTQDAPLLVTDDDRMSRSFYQALLSQQFGFGLLETTNSSDALAICQTQPISLVISCLLKPQGMNGLTLADAMKSDPLLREIPLLVISASQNARALALHAGADAFLSKPCHPNQILHEIWLLLRPHIL